MKIENVVSYFDGMSCGQIALERAGVKVDNYFAYEIDKYAIKVAQNNYPNTKQMGSVVDADLSVIPKGDTLLIGGSPCQGFSFAGKQLNFEDPRSKLFFEFVKAKEFLKPKYFLLENVRMKKEHQDVISKYLGVEPIVINSSLVSAQNRHRLYWTNIPGVVSPEEKDITFSSILQPNNDVDLKYYVSERQLPRLNLGNLVRCGGVAFQSKGKEKSKCDALLARHYKGISGKQHYPIVIEDDGSRKLTPVECERLQTVPDNYTNHVSNSQRYKMLGNGWTVDVIAHIFKNIPQCQK